MARFPRKAVLKKPQVAFQSLPRIPAELCSRTPLVNRLVEWREQSQTEALRKHAVAPAQKKMILWLF
jgi:hypothetical protein